MEGSERVPCGRRGRLPPAGLLAPRAWGGWPDGCVFQLLLVCELGLGALGNGVAVTAVCVGRVLGTPGPVTLEAPPVPLTMDTQAGRAQTGASVVTVCVSMWLRGSDL